MQCLVCLEAPSEAIEIFDENGEKLSIAKILEQHFWFRPVKEEGISTVICQTCWFRVNDFHEFYVQVEQAHSLLTKESCNNVEEPEMKVFPEPENIILLPEPNLETNLLPHDCEEPLMMPVDIAKPDEKDLFEDVADVMPNDVIRPSKRPCNEEEVESSASKSLCVDTQRAKRSRARNRKKETAVTEGETETETDSAGPAKKPSKHIIVEDRWNGEKVDQLIASYMKLICAVCEQEKATFLQLKKHMEEDHEETRGYMMCCNKIFHHRSLLADHVRCHLDPAAFQCKECQRVFTNVHNLRSHINIHHCPDEKKDFPCPECPKGFAKAYLLERHRLDVHAERTYTCDSCQRRLPSENLLRRHIKAFHTREYDIICEVCAKPVRGQEAYERHKLEHAGIPAPRIQCPTCGVWLANIACLKSHIKGQHKEIRKETKCQLCDKVFTKESSLRMHHRNMHGERPHVCLMCGKRFLTRTFLKKHMESHTGESSSNQCTLCPRAYKTAASLVEHRRKSHPVEYKEEVRKRKAKFLGPNAAMEEDSEPAELPVEIKCPDCDKVYPSEFRMKKHHRNMHTGRRPHACTQCDMRFTTPLKLKEHLAVHTGEKLYTCDFCPRTFRSSTTMYGHRKHKHPEEYQKMMQMRPVPGPPKRIRKKKVPMPAESSPKESN